MERNQTIPVLGQDQGAGRTGFGPILHFQNDNGSGRTRAFFLVRVYNITFVIWGKTLYYRPSSKNINCPNQLTDILFRLTTSLYGIKLARLSSEIGYSLVELVVVIVIIGIITSTALRSLRSTSETAKTEQTKKELDQLAWAIAGNPQLVSGRTRTDFGYIGDVGSMPPNLDVLVSNPGYATWDGPYIRDDFYAQDTSSEMEFKIDAWGTEYTYTGGFTITSQGGGTSITREIATSIDDLLRNRVSAVVIDLGNTPPGETYKDSVTFLLTYPNGSGSMTTRTKYPAADGFVQFDSIPIGSHRMQVVYVPTNDTLIRLVNVTPGQDYYSTISLHDNLW